MGWLSRLLVMVVMVGSTSLWAVDGVLPGGGTEADPYLIENLADFDVFADSVNVATYWASGVYTRLACDIDLAGRPYTTAVIAPDTPDTDRYFNGVPFEGIFDGDDHVISNLTIDTAGAANNWLGLFGRIEGSSAEVKDLVMEDIYIIASRDGSDFLGGLCGANDRGTISNSYSDGSVTGGDDSYSLGGLCGGNTGTITRCYSGGSVTGGDDSYSLGGLCGLNRHGTISNCYATGSVTGGDTLGGLCGENWGRLSNSYWNTETSGMSDGVGNQNPDPVGATGRTTEQMQTLSTFVDASWDFDTPVWTIDDGVEYPHLWWALIPVLHTEPEITLGTNNTISWEPIAGAIEYYSECAEDEDFTGIVYDSGWITETSCEFIDLQTGQQYWYRVKAINAVGVETLWSNVESSLQSTLGDAVDMLLDPASLKNENMKNALLNKIDAAMAMIDEGLYEDALDKLRNDILAKTNGCAETGGPDKNDWILACEQQSQVYGLVMETIEYVRSLIE